MATKKETKEDKVFGKVKAKISCLYDGWEIYIDNKRYRWDHNTEDNGTGAIAVILKDLGLEVEITEEC